MEDCHPMNATCPNRDALEAYLLGELDDEAIDAHLSECADCQTALDALDAAVHRPFACLREQTSAPADWMEPTFQQLVADAKALATTPFPERTTDLGPTLVQQT